MFTFLPSRTLLLVLLVVWFPPLFAANAWAGDRPATMPAAGGKRFTLHLGQGFRFADAAVVNANKPDEKPDLTFKYLPPQIGGAALRYNPASGNVEVGREPTLSAAVPLLLAAHVNAFEEKPDASRITTGDAAAYYNQLTVNAKTRHFLLQTADGDAYLLKLDELEAVTGKYDDWRIGFAWEKVQLPLGLAGGKINKPLPGKLLYRDWYRSKMIVGVDLTTGKQEVVADGTLPTTVGTRLLAYGDPSGAYVVRDLASAGKPLCTLRFNQQILGPVLAPDGKRFCATTYRRGPDVPMGHGVMMPGSEQPGVVVYDLAGNEQLFVRDYDDCTWAPDGKLIATGKLNSPGLFEIDPATRAARAIDASVPAPATPCVSPDGRTIAFVTGNRVYLIDRTGRNMHQLVQGGFNQLRPAFSPDGSRLAMIVANQVGSDATGEVFVIDLKTLDVTQLRTSAGLPLAPDTTTRLNWVPQRDDRDK